MAKVVWESGDLRILLHDKFYFVQERLDEDEGREFWHTVKSVHSEPCGGDAWHRAVRLLASELSSTSATTSDVPGIVPGTFRSIMPPPSRNGWEMPLAGGVYVLHGHGDEQAASWKILAADELRRLGGGVGVYPNDPSRKPQRTHLAQAALMYEVLRNHTVCYSPKPDLVWDRTPWTTGEWAIAIGPGLGVVLSHHMVDGVSVYSFDKIDGGCLMRLSSKAEDDHGSNSAGVYALLMTLKKQQEDTGPWMDRHTDWVLPMGDELFLSHSPTTPGLVENYRLWRRTPTAWEKWDFVPAEFSGKAGDIRSLFTVKFIRGYIKGKVPC